MSSQSLNSSSNVSDASSEDLPADQSLLQLVDELCRSLCYDNGIEPNRADVAKYKQQTFKVLLNMLERKEMAIQIDEIKPLNLLLYEIFCLKSKARKKPKCTKISAKLKQLEAVFYEPYFQTDNGRSILHLLFSLQEPIDKNDSDDSQEEDDPNVFPTFTQQLKKEIKYLLPSSTHVQVLHNTKTKYFKDIEDMKTLEKSFSAQVINDSKMATSSPIEWNSLELYSTVPVIDTNKHALGWFGDESCLFTKTVESLVINYNGMRAFPAIEAGNINTSVMPIAKTDEEKESEAENEYVLSLSWDRMENGIQKRSKPFVGSTDLILDMLSFHYKATGQSFRPRIIDTQQLILDLKSLLVGVRSDIFERGETNAFVLMSDITLKDLAPETIRQYVKEFLESGSCYNSLKALKNKDNRGFIFKAVYSAVDEFLMTMRQFVFVQLDNELTMFYKRMKNMMGLVINLAYTLGVHPNVAGNRMPLKTEFLCTLYADVLRDIKNQNIMLSMFLLRRICHVYFRNLQKWIYMGELDDPYDELFIGYSNEYECESKQYYEKAYYVKKVPVPGFVNNFEEKILQCGKYTNLLRAAQPNHPLFLIKCPDISVCLSKAQIKQMEAKCANYHQLASQVCGEPLTIRQIYESRAKVKQNYLIMVKECARINLETWLAERRALALIAKKNKKILLDMLSLQLVEAKNQKVAERRANIEYELRALRDAERMGDKHLLSDNTNTRKTIKYFEDLNKSLQLQTNGEIHGDNEMIVLNSGINSQQDGPKTSNESARQPMVNANEKIYKDSEEGEASSSSSNKLHLHKTHATDNVDSKSRIKSQRPFKTPHSNAGTMYESCFDDEDNGSEYAECISDDFIQNFEESEKDLLALATHGSNNNKDEQENLSPNCRDGFEPTATDIINSNMLTIGRKKSMERNRWNAMCGTSMDECVRCKSSTNYYVNDDCFSSDLKIQLDNNIPMTDAQRSRLHHIALESDLQWISKQETKSMPDINLNTHSENDLLTEFQRNQRHMRQHDEFTQLNNQPINSRRAHMELDFSTERARNRYKVLNSEYDINTGEKNKPTQSHGGGTTPMSTASDMSSTDRSNEVAMATHDLDEHVLKKSRTYKKRKSNKMHACSENDDVDVEEHKKGNAKEQQQQGHEEVEVADVFLEVYDDDDVDEELSDDDDDDDDDDEVVVVCDSEDEEKLCAEVVEKSYDAKSAELCDDDEAMKVCNAENIETSDEEAEDIYYEAEKMSNEVDVAKLYDENEMVQEKEDITDDEKELSTHEIELLTEKTHLKRKKKLWSKYGQEYARTSELLETNFKCNALNPYFCFYKLPTEKSTETRNAVATLQQFNLNSITVITMSEYLQQSIIKPMLTHFDLVNNEVMRLFLNNLSILNHFRSLRNYFFMMDGEFGTVICEGLITDLEKRATPDTLFSYHTLHTVLVAAIGTNMASRDTNSNNLRFLVEPLPEKFDLSSANVLNALNLRYHVDWPLNIVLTPETLRQYNNIFKYLLKTQRINWLLENCYHIMKDSIKCHGTIILKSPQYCHIQQIRHKLYHFVHTLQNHTMTNAFQASWKIFKDDIMDAHNIEDIYRKHVTYLKRVLFLCMLNRSSAEFHKSIDIIFQITLQFVRHLKSANFELRKGHSYFTHAKYNKMVNDELEFDKFVRYTIYLGNKIVCVGYQSEIGEFISMLNFNGYYMQDYDKLRRIVIRDKKRGALEHIQNNAIKY